MNCCAEDHRRHRNLQVITTLGDEYTLYTNLLLLLAVCFVFSFFFSFVFLRVRVIVAQLLRFLLAQFTGTLLVTIKTKRYIVICYRIIYTDWPPTIFFIWKNKKNKRNKCRSQSVIDQLFRNWSHCFSFYFPSNPRILDLLFSFFYSYYLFIFFFNFHFSRLVYCII